MQPRRPPRALATDYDGTLAEGPRPTSEVLEALAGLRRRGRALVLVTGRMGHDLRRIFPDVDGYFDALVVENGAVLDDVPLVPPVPEALAEALRARDLPVERGQVLLATETRHEPVVRAECLRLGLALDLCRNRDALMILPPGVSKGSGVRAALAALGIPPADTVGLGDSENDEDLLAACGLGVAVADAVEALKQRAGRVLPAGGLVDFLRSL